MPKTVLEDCFEFDIFRNHVRTLERGIFHGIAWSIDRKGEARVLVMEGRGLYGCWALSPQRCGGELANGAGVAPRFFLRSRLGNRKRAVFIARDFSRLGTSDELNITYKCSMTSGRKKKAAGRVRTLAKLMGTAAPSIPWIADHLEWVPGWRDWRPGMHVATRSRYLRRLMPEEDIGLGNPAMPDDGVQKVSPRARRRARKRYRRSHRWRWRRCCRPHSSGSDWPAMWSRCGGRQSRSQDRHQ